MTGGIIETPCDASPPYAYTSSSVQSHTLQQKAIATATEKISDNDIPSCCAMKLVSKEIYWDLVQHGQSDDLINPEYMYEYDDAENDDDSDENELDRV